ncbi:hypothetical protein [Rhodoferax sp.]|uniref:Ppx/GppA phosphatase family protein n=1 Tax=Rhodoferax sp. TaxID=50421 RepID=UPI001EC8B83F|nr:hypothetical protein [Rhodoferax sp.]MBT9508572.1 hypothetical protein [Rhodoferax sp.]
MPDAIRQSYAAIRRNASPATSMVLLHIGDDRTCVAAGMGIEPDQVLVLDIGFRRISSEFFKHNPPTPMEIENAIMVVEDEVTRAQEMALERAPLYSTDEVVHTMARIAGCADALMDTLTIEQVERLFNQLAARSEGRPSSQVEIPDDPTFAAALLILREFMHHLHFDYIKFERKSQHADRSAHEKP